jgi:hypothetical protein
VISDKNQVPDDDNDMLRSGQRVFGTSEPIDNASKDDLSEGLLSLHAFLEQRRLVKGGRESLVPYFWSQNNSDVQRVKSL